MKYDELRKDINAGRVPFIDDRGEVYTVLPEDVAAARATGDRVAQPQEVDSLIEAAEYDSPVVAAGLGAARGLTLGMSDFATGFMPGGAEVTRKYKEHNPGWSTGGEIAGSLLPLAFSGGAAAAPTGLKGALGLAGAGGVARVGSAVGRRLVPEAAKQTMGRSIARKAVEGATEGALFQVSQEISKSALDDDPEFSADSLLANIGFGTLIGGGVGGALGALGVAAKPLKKMLGPKNIGYNYRYLDDQTELALSKDIEQVLAKADEADLGMVETYQLLGDMWKKEIIGNAPKSNPINRLVFEGYSRMARLRTPATKEDLKALFKNKAAASMTDDQRNALVSKFTDRINHFNDGMADLFHEVGKKQSQLSQIAIESVDPGVARHSADALLQATRRVIDEMNERTARYTDAGVRSNLAKAATKMKEEIDQAQKVGAAADRYHTIISDFKKDVGAMAKFDRMIHPQHAKASYKKVGEVYQAAKNNLRDTEVWGEVAVHKINFDDYFSAWRRSQDWMMKNIGRKMPRETGPHYTYRVDSGKMRAFLKDLTEERNIEKSRAFADYLEASESTMFKLSGILDDPRFTMRTFMEDHMVMNVIKDQLKISNLQRGLRRQAGQAGILEMSPLMLGGQIGSSGIGIAAGMPASVFLYGGRDPARTVATVHRVNQMIGGVTQKINNAAQKLIDKAATKGGVAAGVSAATKIASDRRSKDYDQKDAWGRLEEDLEALGYISGDVLDEVSEALAPLGPVTDQVFRERAGIVVRNIKARQPQRTGALPPGDRARWAFDQYRFYALNPQKALEDMEKRGYITRPMVDALRENYPGWYAKLVDAVQLRMAAKPPSRQARLRINRLLGIKPQHNFQPVYAPAQQEQGATQITPPEPTQAQRITER